MSDEDYDNNDNNDYNDDDNEQQQEQYQEQANDDDYEQQEEQQQQQQESPEPEQKEEPKQEEQQQQQQQYYGGGGDVDVPPNVEAACKSLYADNPGFNWFTAKLVDPKAKKTDLIIDSAGSGGLNEIKQYLAGQQDHIIFFQLRVNTLDDEQSSRAKFIYGRFMGSKVPFMAKARLTPNLGEIANKFGVKHLSKDCDESMKDWDEEKLSKEFLRFGGAHKPSKYDYGGGLIYKVV